MVRPAKTTKLNGTVEESFIQLIQDHQPQQHGSKWTKDEEQILYELISQGVSLEYICEIISLRTSTAIYTKANYLGYGYERNKDNGLTYFNKDINHKNRRTKNEILADEGKVPIKSAISVEDCDKESTVIIADESKVGHKLKILEELNKIEVIFNEGTQRIKSIKKAL